MTDKEKLDAIRAEIHRLVDVRGYDREMANDLFTFMDSLPNESANDDLEKIPCNHCQGSNDKEKCDELVFGRNCPIIKKPVSDDLEEAAKNHAAERYRTTRDRELAEKCKWSFKAGAEWQKKHLWKDAQGDDLPEIDREVIVLSENGYIAFGHRPNPDGWDGRSIGTNEVTHYTPKLYDKGGWNQPNVKWWLDIEKLPNMEE